MCPIRTTSIVIKGRVRQEPWQEVLPLNREKVHLDRSACYQQSALSSSCEEESWSQLSPSSSQPHSLPFPPPACSATAVQPSFISQLSVTLNYPESLLSFPCGNRSQEMQRICRSNRVTWIWKLWFFREDNQKECFHKRQCMITYIFPSVDSFSPLTSIVPPTHS